MKKCFYKIWFYFFLGLILKNCSKCTKLNNNISADEARVELMQVFPKDKERAEFMGLPIGQEAVELSLEKYFGDDASKIFDAEGNLNLKELQKLVFDQSDFFDFFADSLQGNGLRFPKLSEDPVIIAFLDLLNKCSIGPSKDKGVTKKKTAADINKIVEDGFKKAQEFLENYHDDEASKNLLREIKAHICIDDSGQFDESKLKLVHSSIIKFVEKHENSLASIYMVVSQINENFCDTAESISPFSNLAYIGKNKEILCSIVLKEIRRLMQKIKESAIKYKKIQENAKKLNPSYKSTDPRAFPFQLPGKDWKFSDGRTNKLYFKHGKWVDPTTRDDFIYLLDDWVVDQVYIKDNTFEAFSREICLLTFDEIEID